MQKNRRKFAEFQDMLRMHQRASRVQHFLGPLSAPQAPRKYRLAALAGALCTLCYETGGNLQNGVISNGFGDMAVNKIEFEFSPSF